MTEFNAAQVSTFIGGDQWVFRANSSEEMSELLKSHATSVLDDLATFKQAATAKAVFTETNGAKSGNKKASPGEAPPDGSNPKCRHGERKWLDYTKKDGTPVKGWYCSAPWGEKNKCEPIKS